jgi:predicted FMN-binding regulatory protein PaiB
VAAKKSLASARGAGFGHGSLLFAAQLTGLLPRQVPGPVARHALLEAPPLINRSVIGFDLPIERLEAKFKMGQDERLYDTAGAIGALEQNDPALAAMMKAHNAHRKD